MLRYVLHLLERLRNGSERTTHPVGARSDRGVLADVLRTLPLPPLVDALHHLLERRLDLEVPGVKGRKATTRRLAFAEIDRARVQVEFNRKDKKDMKEEEEA